MKLVRNLAPWLLLLYGASAQQPAPIERPPNSGPITTIHVESRLVSVALNVVDETGAPVGGLTINDFELAEDGKPLPIAHFDRESVTPLEIVLAIDASGSVWTDERLERMRQRLLCARCCGRRTKSI